MRLVRLWVRLGLCSASRLNRRLIKASPSKSLKALSNTSSIISSQVSSWAD
ncbi:hypothetical protein HanPSC8_Chr17g0787331 [Helianthus annuus]|nr:hypothetical protein HanPSC8_Chr17g0787331 [Helianthus annuus]